MNTQHRIPEYVDGLLDLDALRIRANALDSRGARPAANASPPGGKIFAAIAALGFAASAVAAIALGSAPAKRANDVVPDGRISFSEQVKRNAHALRRSRAWWERYGQGQRSAARVATVKDYAQSPNRDWFRNLTNQYGIMCCDAADGVRLEDPDWEFDDRGYRVRIKGRWMRVPPQAIVRQPNKVGYAIVWPWKEDGQWRVGCFMPGTAT